MPEGGSGRDQLTVRALVAEGHDCSRRREDPAIVREPLSALEPRMPFGPALIGDQVVFLALVQAAQPVQHVDVVARAHDKTHIVVPQQPSAVLPGLVRHPARRLEGRQAGHTGEVDPRVLHPVGQVRIPPVGRERGRRESRTCPEVVEREDVPRGVGVERGEEGAAYGPRIETWVEDGAHPVAVGGEAELRPRLATHRDPLPRKGKDADDGAIVARDHHFQVVCRVLPERGPPRPHDGEPRVELRSRIGGVEPGPVGAQGVEGGSVTNDVDVHARASSPRSGSAEVRSCGRAGGGARVGCAGRNRVPDRRRSRRRWCW